MTSSFSTEGRHSRIASFGRYLPPRVVKNSDLEKIMNTSDEWIQQRSGIRERRWVEPGVTMRNMATIASQEAIRNAGWEVDDVDAIIFSTLLSDYIFPGTGVLLQKDLGIKNNVSALDIRNQCSGFLYGLQVADALIRVGTYNKILIATCEIHSTSMNQTPEGRDLGVLFGDAASSCCVEACHKDSPMRLMAIQTFSQGAHAEKLALMEPSPNAHPRLSLESLSNPLIFPVMDGKFVFKNAVERMSQSLTKICEDNNVNLLDIDFVIAHQANQRIIDAVLQQLGIPSNKTHCTLDRLANTTSCSIPLTFQEAMEMKKIKSGDLVALTAFGSGFTWGSALLQN